MNISKMKYTSWGVMLLGLLIAGCKDDDADVEVMPEPVLSVTTTDVVFDQAGGTKNLEFTTNRGWTIVCTEGGWVEVEGAKTGEPGNQKLSLIAVPNVQPKSRTAKFTVTAASKSEVVEFTQFGTDPEVIAGQKQLKPGCDGGIIGMAVHTNAAPLTAVAQEDWITVASTPYQSASYMYQIEVKPNTGAERTGHVVFSAESVSDMVTIVQAAYEPRLEVTKEAIKVSALSRRATLAFTTNARWTLEWIGNGKPEWVSGVEPVQGEPYLKNEIQFTLLSNVEDGATERSAQFKIKYGEKEQTFTLHQAEPVLSEIGTRETDSIAIAEIYKKIKGDNKPVWDLTLPMNKWGMYEDGEFMVSSLSFSGEGRVIGIKFVDFTIEGGLPEEIGDICLLRSISFINLTAKNMSLPASINKLGDLQKLSIMTGDEGGEVVLPDLSKNTALYDIFLSGQNPGFKEVNTPVFQIDGIRGVGSLENLAVHYANIGNLPDLSSSNKLRTLVIRMSDITRFPSEIAGFSDLKHLELSDCLLEGELPDIFTNTALITCDLHNNRLSGELPLGMFTSNTLSTLTISGNDFTGNLPVELSTKSKLNYFSCRENRLGGKNFQKLPPELLKDERWDSNWYGPLNICVQQPDYGWSNCPTSN